MGNPFSSDFCFQHFADNAQNSFLSDTNCPELFDEFAMAHVIEEPLDIYIHYNMVLAVV
ncbi:hypothetical protein KSC_001110 [Ktedonobacter sp. SOSP1-52]|nr:hypothetical protein KSC_001110 [Ktedonobacter sp. SOSP1-52]